MFTAMTESSRPTITFFHLDNCERQAVQPIADEARRRGFPIRFSSNMAERAQIGVYCQHACRPNADLSIIMLHDLAQRHDIWPSFWAHEPWNEFDIGFVPGEAWAQRWRTQAGQIVANPRYGIFDIGWPKADLIYRDEEEFAQQSKQLRVQLGLKYERTVLYAPSWENHGKQDDFVRSLMDLPVNLLLKQAPWSPAYSTVWDNIRAMNSLHQGIADNVHIIDPEVSIMYCIGIADLLVSDESSVLIEASLHGIPSVAVSDWLIPDRNPPRPACVPFDHVRKTTRAELRATVEEIFTDSRQAHEDALRLRDFHFSHFGQSARLAVDVVEAALDGCPSSVEHMKLATNERLQSGSFAYSDGDEVESRLLRAINEAKDVSVGSEELLKHITDWATLYHLSSSRANLLRPLENKLRGKKVLELGSGCGAISRFLGEIGCELTCVEGSPRRAKITAARCRGLHNVKVYNDNFQDFETDDLFDVVTLIGVLEYSRKFIKGEDPVVEALALTRRFLRPGGVLVIAIENKLGLKYWAGAPEDHVGVPFFGIEGLYGDSTAVTFGRQELKRLLVSNGFPDVEFYFPYPDYKVPTTILAEEIEMCDPAIAINLLSPMFAPDQTVGYARTFSEGAAYRSIIENGLLGDFANSFLALAKKEAHDWPCNKQDLAFVYSPGRASQLAKEVKLQRSATRISVKRRLLYAASAPDFMSFPEEEALKPGELLFNSLLAVINRRGWEALDVARWFRPLCDQLLSLSEIDDDGIRRINATYLDASPFNFIHAQENYSFFDLEWDDGTTVNFWFPVLRGLYYSLSKVGTVAMPAAGTPLRVIDLVVKVIQALGGGRIDVEAFIEDEVRFLERVINRKPSISAMAMTTLQVRGGTHTKEGTGSTGPVAYVEETVERWLEKRKPTKNDLPLITRTFESCGGGAKFGIFILDLGGELDAVIASIKSLDADKNFYDRTRVVVLTVLSIPAEHSSDDLRFVNVNERDFIGALNQEVAGSACEWFMLIEAGEEFTASGLQTLALELLEAPDCRAVYGDELHRQPDTSLSSWFRPAFNLDYLLSYPAAMSHHWFFRRDVFVAHDGFDPQFPQAFELDLILRLVESGGMAGLAHVDEPILIANTLGTCNIEDEQQVVKRHLQARGYEHALVSSSAPGQHRIEYGHDTRLGVSILIPLEASLGKLQRCVETLLEHTDYPRYDVVLIVGHKCPVDISGWANKIAAISEGRIKVFEYPEASNTSAMYNAAAVDVGGEYLVILSGDVEFVSGDWLTEMLNHAQRPEVGIVGPKISYSSGRVRHAGIVLGLRGPAGGAFIGQAGDAPGYMSRLQVVQNYSAVSRACMMVSRSVFIDVGGLDTVSLARDFTDVDFCLKVQTAGYLTVWTPFATLCQGIESAEEKAVASYQEQLETERHALYEKWLPQLARDPAYNQNLSLDGFGFTPAYRKTREWNHIGPSVLPRVLCHPSDANGCGHYRLHQPFSAMERDMLVHGMSTDKLMAPVELERFSPDSIIYQRQFTAHSLLLREESNIYKGVFRVMDMDDFIPGVPEKSIHYNEIPKNVMTYISKALSLVDRFVVSTAPLAEAFAGLHPDIQVVQNRLPVEWWGDLQSRRRVGRKPRVGWAGGTSHTGDLELLFDVVRTLANEVEWVFFGMCPDLLKPYIHEFHSGITIERYPERLASLNLDLALAPLEMNLFNECKSNLRLLEYGACGFPVICTDIVTYRCGMPVTLVKNRTEDWLEAIRMHLSDLDASAEAGDALREVVMRDWMLQGDALLEWRNAWLPS